MGGGVHELHIPVRTGGIFYFLWHRHQYYSRRDRRILVSPPKDTGKAGLTELQSSEAKFPQWDSNPAGGQSGRQSKPTKT